MKQFMVLLILLVCLVIGEDYTIHVKSRDKSWKKDKNNSIRIALEDLLKVGVKKLKIFISGGWINTASVYETDKKEKLFVKKNSKLGADKMFQGEFESLKALRDSKVVWVPNPIATGSTRKDKSSTKKNRHFIVMEYLKITPTDNMSSQVLGSQLADLHLQNLLDKNTPIKKFGFHIDTNSGFILQNNKWKDDWITFFIENRLDYQIKLLQLNGGNNSRRVSIVRDYWPQLREKIPKFFDGIHVRPSLLHGDLWSENVGQIDLKPVIFDPATYYGHHEYDIASSTLYGGFSKSFYDAYYKKIPRAKWYKKRMTLYHLCHYLNHWNNFGSGFANTVIRKMETLMYEYD